MNVVVVYHLRGKMKIHSACMTFNEAPDLIRNVESMLPYIDSCTIIDGGSQDITLHYFRNWAKIEPKIRLFLNKWQDDFPKQRNFYCDKVREISQDGDWMLTFDPDESFPVETLQNLRRLADVVYKKKEKFKRIAFRCRSITMRGPEKCYENADQYWKPLFIRIGPNVRYDHNGEGAVHEILKGADPVYYTGHHPETPELFYTHTKQEHSIWSHAVRNYHCGGGGPNLGSKNHRWVELRAIAKRLGLDAWHDMHKYLIAGNIDNELKQWIIKYRHETGWEGSSEQREWFKYFFFVLHPEELPPELKGERIE